MAGARKASAYDDAGARDAAPGTALLPGATCARPVLLVSGRAGAGCLSGPCRAERQFLRASAPLAGRAYLRLRAPAPATGACPLPPVPPPPRQLGLIGTSAAYYAVLSGVARKSAGHRCHLPPSAPCT